MASQFRTHEVTNQVPPYAGRNLWNGDPVLQALVKAGGPPPADLAEMGERLGSAASFELARLANVNPPVLKTHDPYGRRLDAVEFHPAYHALMRSSIEAGLAGSIWERGGFDGRLRHRARAARFYMTGQVECGHLCPLTMTSASAAALSHAPELAAEWLPKIASRVYDAQLRPLPEKAGVTLGMAMTEKQGGSDVRANTTMAAPVGEGAYRLLGHKWFMSAPMSDAFLVLAQAPGGLTCFLMPRLLPDGTVNAVHLQRLKDKLGNRSNASSEVEFTDALAWRVGEEGRGIATIIEMVALTRVDCAIASAAMMRHAVARAVHHARHRLAFQKHLLDQPLMTRVLADLALDAIAATALAFRLAEALDRIEEESEAALVRLLTPAAKYWVCKAAPALVLEAMECLGGNGYVEEHDLARLYREAPVNAIWEGSGNVVALDILRAIARAPASLDATIATLSDLGDGGASADVIRAAVEAARADEGSARLLAEQIALAVAAASMARLLPQPVAAAFMASRLGGRFRSTYGMLDARFNARAIVDFAFPEDQA